MKTFIGIDFSINGTGVTIINDNIHHIGFYIKSKEIAEKKIEIKQLNELIIPIFFDKKFNKIDDYSDNEIQKIKKIYINSRCYNR